MLLSKAVILLCTWSWGVHWQLTWVRPACWDGEWLVQEQRESLHNAGDELWYWDATISVGWALGWLIGHPSTTVSVVTIHQSSNKQSSPRCIFVGGGTRYKFSSYVFLGGVNRRRVGGPYCIRPCEKQETAAVVLIGHTYPCAAGATLGRLGCLNPVIRWRNTAHKHTRKQPKQPKQQQQTNPLVDTFFF